MTGSCFEARAQRHLLAPSTSTEKTSVTFAPSGDPRSTKVMRDFADATTTGSGNQRADAAMLEATPCLTDVTSWPLDIASAKERGELKAVGDLQPPKLNSRSKANDKTRP